MLPSEESYEISTVYNLENNNRIMNVIPLN